MILQAKIYKTYKQIKLEKKYNYVVVKKLEDLEQLHVQRQIKYIWYTVMNIATRNKIDDE